MTRKLCSIQKIIDIQPIQGADSIEKAIVLGWELVIKKGEYKVGDLVIYCEIDTILPEIPETEFMRSHKFRVRTIKLRGQVSQGLILPLSVAHEAAARIPVDIAEEEGVEVTELIGASKYEARIPVESSRTIKGSFPSLIPKTDEERIQAIPDILEKFKGTPIYVTEKLDGMSCTMYLIDGIFGICSRNFELIEDENNPLWKLAKKYDIENKLRLLGMDIAIQGEVVGEGIQKNPLNLKGQDFFVFNIFNTYRQEYLSYHEFIHFCQKFELKTVPIWTSDIPLSHSLKELLELANTNSLLNPESKTEGLVIRSVDHVQEKYVDDEMGIEKVYKTYRLSFKVISPEYSLTHED